MKVSQAVLALDLVDPQLNLAESMVLIFLEVGKGDFENTPLKSIIGILQTGGAVDEGLPNTIVP